MKRISLETATAWLILAALIFWVIVLALWFF
jgi:hypothetical protein